MYNHRAMVSNRSNRIIEMLDAIRVEYDQLGQEAYMSKSQRDEFEHKSKLHCWGEVYGLWWVIDLVYISMIKYLVVSECSSTRNE